jgi:hypothetical protein
MVKIGNKNTGPDFNNMKCWHPHLPFGQHISVSTLVIWPKKNQKLVGVKGAYLKHSFNVLHEEKMKYMLGVSIYCLRVYSFTIWLWYCSGDVLFLCFSLFICRPCAYFYVFHCISVYFALLVTVPWIKRVYYLHKL